ncbi:hypothetical protein [Nocardia sp. NPDC127526]|uniref:hypothetical protein n=1 Tax=Nocardia sp. NPDC127526 TaxID=3345393 RepID=UPI003638D138
MSGGLRHGPPPQSMTDQKIVDSALGGPHARVVGIEAGIQQGLAVDEIVHAAL